MVPCLVGEGEGTEELREVGKVAVLESVSDCGHDPRVVPLALAVHRVSLYVHQFTCTCVCELHTIQNDNRKVMLVSSTAETD